VTAGWCTKQVKKEYAGKFNLVVSDAGFDNTFAILVRGADARRLKLKRFLMRPQATIGARVWSGLHVARRWHRDFEGYGLKFAEQRREMDLR